MDEAKSKLLIADTIPYPFDGIKMHPVYNIKVYGFCCADAWF